MRHQHTFIVLSAVSLLSIAAARDASAQGFLNPFIGATLSSPSPLGGRSQPGFGVAIGSIGLIFGSDFEIAWYPEVVDNQPNGLSQSRAITLSASTLIGPRIGPVKVYGAFGGGDTIVSAAPLSALTNLSLDNLSAHFFTLNTGGGAMVFFAHHLGVRGDVRHLRAYGVANVNVPGTSVTVNHFGFWRGTIGLAVKF